MVKKQTKAKILKSKAFPEEPNITVDNHSAGTNRTKKITVAAVRHICSTRVTTDFAFAWFPSARYWATYLMVAEGKAKVPMTVVRAIMKVKRA